MDPNESFQTTENKTEGTKAESVMIAGLFVVYGRDYVELCKKTGRIKEARAKLYPLKIGARGQLQEWFEDHWNRASDVTEDVIRTVARHTHLYTPFDVYAKALQEYFRGHELSG